MCGGHVRCCMSLDHENDVHHVLLHLDLTHTLQQEDKMIHTEEEQFRFSVYTYPVFKNKTRQKQNRRRGKLLSHTGSPARGSVMTQRGRWGKGGREVQERGDACTHTADSLRCRSETNTTLPSNYTPSFKKSIE